MSVIWGSERFLGSHLALRCLDNGQSASEICLLQVDSKLNPLAHFPELSAVNQYALEGLGTQSIADLMNQSKAKVLYVALPEMNLSALQGLQGLLQEFFWLLEVLRQTESVEQVVLFSTDKVYPFGSDKECFEKDPLQAQDLYSAAWISIESIVQSFQREIVQKSTFGRVFQWTVIRSANVIGARDYRPESFVQKWHQTKQAGSPWILKNPHSLREWLDVIEVVDVTTRLAEVRLKERNLKENLVDVYNYSNEKAWATVQQVSDFLESIYQLNNQFKNALIPISERPSDIRAHSRKLNCEKMSSKVKIKNQNWQETIRSALPQ